METTELIELFIRDVCAGKTNETPAAYRSKLTHLERYIGAGPIDQASIDGFKRSLLERNVKRRGGIEVKGGLSKFTIRSILSTTRHFLRWCASKQLLPVITLQNIKEPAADPKAIDPVTVDKLLAAALETGPAWERARNTAIIYTLRDTGGRVGVIARLDINDMDLAAGYATVINKGDQPGWLWFNPPTIEAIKVWLHYRCTLGPVDYKVFTGARGAGIGRQGIYRMLSRLAAAAGVTGRYNPHSFRHGFARDSLLAGADLGQVSQMMGHRSIVVTDKYYGRWKQRELKRFHRRYSPGRLLPRVKGSAKP